MFKPNSMLITAEKSQYYTLHSLVLSNDLASLTSILATFRCTELDPSLPYPTIELRDEFGRTALHLACQQGSVDMVKVLVVMGRANTLARCQLGWSVYHEAVAKGNRDSLKWILCKKRYDLTQKFLSHATSIANQLNQNSPDFQFTLHWGFKSWVPLVANLCPSDSYIIRKQGTSLRIDSTLVGFENFKWQRGNRSFLFKLDEKEGPVLTLVDHVHKVTQRVLSPRGVDSIEVDLLNKQELDELEVEMNNYMSSKQTMMTLPIDKITVSPEFSGVWGFRSNRKERIGSYDCHVYKLEQLNLITHTRSDHLVKFEPNFPKSKDSKSTISDKSKERNVEDKNPCNGKKTINPMTATLWLAKQECNPMLPITLAQLQPIFELTDLISEPLPLHIDQFLSNKLPSGLPLKLQIPILPMLHANININDIILLKGHQQEIKVPGLSEGYVVGRVVV